ncbi:MAG: HU family DNA-binding protein [Vigna little leaf phytoplasma]|nr:HU family DNA-binding protein [Vigna little leaf phytoplasma]
MNKEEFIQVLAQEGQVSPYEAEQFFKVFEKVLVKAIRTNAEVRLGRQLGRFILKPVKSSLRPSLENHYNKKTGQWKTITKGKRKIPAYTAVRFRPSEFLKREVKGIKLKIKK